VISDQSNPLRKVGECLYRNGHGVYFAWFSVRGKQVKRSLKTNDKELARRRLGELRNFTVRTIEICGSKKWRGRGLNRFKEA
jgi:hypothetical protein